MLRTATMVNARANEGNENIGLDPTEAQTGDEVQYDPSQCVWAQWWVVGNP